MLQHFKIMRVDDRYRTKYKVDTVSWKHVRFLKNNCSLDNNRNHSKKNETMGANPHDRLPLPQQSNSSNTRTMCTL